MFLYAVRARQRHTKWVKMKFGLSHISMQTTEREVKILKQFPFFSLSYKAWFWCCS